MLKSVVDCFAGQQMISKLILVFRDNRFVSVAVKINGEQSFRQRSPVTKVKSL